MLELLFLGTGASVPCRERSLPCVAVRRGRDVTLFDCGEGSQRQLMVSPFSFMKVNRIFISHMHGDHVLGLPGLLQTMGMSGRTAPLSVFGPPGVAAGLDAMLGACEGEIGYPLGVREASGGDVFRFDGFSVRAFATSHTASPSLGFVMREDDAPGRLDTAEAERLGIRPGPEFARLLAGEAVRGVAPERVVGPPRRGCSVAYTGDTVPCPELDAAVRGVTALVHESTFSDSDRAAAEAHRHSTAAQAAAAAARAGADALFLVHISNRYDDPGLIEVEARRSFPRSFAPADLDMFRVLPSGVRSA